MKKVLFLFLLVVGAHSVKAQQWGNSTTAQVDPLGPQYFQNQYLGNPAMAGIDSGLHINGAYRKQWSDVPGVPVTTAVTADYAMGKRVGVGLNIYNDKAGLLSNTRVAATYAYHLPLTASGNQQLHFGLSVGIRAQHVDAKAINGDPNDPSVGAFNRRDNYFDADYGMAYTNNGLTIQAALPNMIGYFKEENKTQINSATFYSAVGYKIYIGSQVTSIEPKLAFRGVRGFDNILDVGANIAFLDNAANVYGMYHTSKNFTVGAGYDILKTVGLLLSYSSQTAGLSNYFSGNFTLGIKVDLLK